MAGRTRFLAVSACCAYPVLSHAAVVLDEPRWATAGIAVVAWAAASFRYGWLVAAALGLVVLGAGLALAGVAGSVLLYAPPLLLNLALCAVFGGTLRRGREPLVSRFARIERGGDLPADLARYTRRVTWAWTAFFVLMAGISLALAVWGSAWLWSLFTNLVNFILVAVFFASEYLYRRVRFRHYTHASPAELIRRLHTYRPFPRPADGNY